MANYDAEGVRVLLEIDYLLSDGQFDEERVADLLCSNYRGVIIHVFGEPEPVDEDGEPFEDCKIIRSQSTMAMPKSIESLSKAVTNKPPFCTGTVPISSEEAVLFYKQISWLNLSQATESQLKSLTEACEPATFGRNKKDVLDESYRKARKMDTEDFASKVNIEKLGVLDRIKMQLLDCSDNWKTIRAEPYKLNIY
ncbi:hypothetical protein H0H93_014307, partial [Arthromyces matolae]